MAKVLPLAGAQVVASLPSTMSLAVAANVATAPAALVASLVMFAGQLTVGAVVSSTLTVKEFTPVLPWPSLAEQVTVVVPIANVVPEAGLQLTETVPAQTSLALAVKLTVAPAAPVASAVIGKGTVTTGAAVSWTVTLKEFMPVLPLPSLAEQVTVVVPSAKLLPEAGEQVTSTDPAQASLALALKVTVAWPLPVHSAVIGEGTVTVGATVSWTVTLKEFMPVLPLVSVAEQVTVVVPSAKLVPEAGLQVTETGPSQISLALALKVTVA